MTSEEPDGRHSVTGDIVFDETSQAVIADVYATGLAQITELG